jgi:purine-nucleoside phosphorylase
MEVQVLYATEEEWEKEEVRVNKITDRLNNPENHNKTE